MSTPTLWPRPGDTALMSARKVATVYRTHLHTANREVCDRIDDAMRHIGQTWILPQMVTYDVDTNVIVTEAAAIAGVQPATIRQWASRGYLDRDRIRRYLAVRGKSDGGLNMYNVGEVLAAVACTRS